MNWGWNKLIATFSLIGAVISLVFLVEGLNYITFVVLLMAWFYFFFSNMDWDWNRLIAKFLLICAVIWLIFLEEGLNYIVSFGWLLMSWFYFFLSNLGRKQTKVIHTGHRDKGIRIQFILIGLNYAYSKVNIPIERTREFTASFFKKENYTIRQDRADCIDIVCSSDKIVVYDYTSDIREQSMIVDTFHDLQSFLKSRLEYGLEFLQPSVELLREYDRQYKESGKIDSFLALKNTMQAPGEVEKRIKEMEEFVDASYYIKILQNIR